MSETLTTEPKGLQEPWNNRILVIDDNAAIHEDFRQVLQRREASAPEMDAKRNLLFGDDVTPDGRACFQVDSASQGREGSELARRARMENRPYAVAFVDFRMPPGWDGVETIGKLWEFDPDLQVVLCTAYSDYSWEDINKRIGLSDRLVILKKPFDTIEVLQLASAMTEKWRLLQQTRRRMGELEHLVAERTRHLVEANEGLEAEVARRIRHEHCLNVQSKVTSVLADSTAPSAQVVPEILKLICQLMRWDLGKLWLVDSKANLLRCPTVWHLPGSEFAEFDSAWDQILLESGMGLPGRVWRSGAPAWLADAEQEENPAASVLDRRAGMKSGFAFPLRLQGEVLGILELRSREVRQPEPDVLEMFATLGSLIGQSLDRKKLEEQLRQSQKMDAIGHLAGGVAHDFNNILLVIQGYSQILGKDPKLSKETADGLDQIFRAAQRAASLTRQLLAFSRRQVIHARTLDLGEVASETSKMLQRVIGEDVALKVERSPAPVLIEADEDMLVQVLINLASNSRDAMPNGGMLRISAQARTLDEGAARQNPEARAGDFACLRVTDTGAGIKPEDLARIFEPFFTTKGIGKGTGLGLATVYGIVKQHQGWIETTSQPGQGTTFSIFFPRSKQAPKASTDKADANVPGGTETILLVEDEEPVRTLVRGTLQRLSYRVIEAESGAQALSVWDQHPGQVDLLLTDMVMPEGVSGRELVQRLQAKKPALKFIYTTGYSRERATGAMPLPPGSHFLQKPYDLRKLAQTVRLCLDGKPAV
jgi:signal transduction histidine kinase/response regulator RpfG family c-di-GMP phosphodiesterase